MSKSILHLYNHLFYVFYIMLQNCNIDNGVKSHLELVKALGRNDARENDWSCLIVKLQLRKENRLVVISCTTRFVCSIGQVKFSLKIHLTIRIRWPHSLILS